jgi:exonuclease III
MDKYYIGYSTIDNYTYFLYIKYNEETNNIYFDGQKVPINKIKKNSNNKINIIASTPYFEYMGIIKDDSFTGICTILQDAKKLSSGDFVTTKVEKKDYNNMLKYKTGWEWLMKGVKSIKPKIYPELDKPNKFINVMSFNICSTFIWTGEEGIRKTANIIKNNYVDIILLQEIGKPEFEKLALVLNKSFKSKYYYNYDGGIISKYKIDKVYKRTPISPIYGVRVKVDKETKIRVFNSHLDNNGYYNVKDSYHYQLPHLNFGLYKNVYNKNNDPNLASLLCGDHNIVSHLDEEKEWAVSKKLYKDGWIDSYREVNKEVRKDKDYTYPNCETSQVVIKNEIGKACGINKNKYRHRIDYIYSKNGEKTSLRPISSKIVNQYSSKFPSDHNAVLTKFLIIN